MNKISSFQDIPKEHIDSSEGRMNEIKLCKNCFCITHNKKGYIYICGKCGKDRRRKKR